MESKKPVLAVEVLLFVLIVLLDGLGYLPISQTIYLIPFIFITLRLQKEKFSSIGFSLKEVSLPKSIVIGILLGVALELIAAYGTTPVISSWFGTEPAMNDLQEVKGNLPLLFIFIALSWVLAAFGEEICFRGFLMNRLGQLLGNTRPARIAGLILSSILFGLGHTEQGIAGWIQEGLSGLYLGIIFLAMNKNLVVPIVSHGVSNTLALILIYFGHYPGIH